MTLYAGAAIAIVVILIGAMLARAIPGFVFICTRDGTTMISEPRKFPTHCRNGHRMRMLFSAPSYCIVMFVGDLAMCILLAHFVLQPFIPSLTRLIIVFAVLGIVASVKDLVTVPPKVRAVHRVRVSRHYIGALIGHLAATMVILMIDWRTI